MICGWWRTKVRAKQIEVPQGLKPGIIPALSDGLKAVPFKALKAVSFKALKAVSKAPKAVPFKTCN